MIFVAVAISLVIGFVVAAGVIGVQAQRLGRQRREPVWRLAEAAAFVAECLPFEAAAALSGEELETLLRGHLNQLQFGKDAAPEDAAVDGAAPEDAAVVMEDQASVAALYRTMRRQGVEISLGEVTAVIAAHLEYLRRIGALAQAQPSDI